MTRPVSDPNEPARLAFSELMRHASAGTLDARGDWKKPLCDQHNPDAPETLKIDAGAPGAYLCLTRMPDGAGAWRYSLRAEQADICVRRQQFRPVECDAMLATMRQRIAGFMALRHGDDPTLRREEIYPLLREVETGLTWLKSRLASRRAQNWADRPDIPAPARTPEAIATPSPDGNAR